MSRCGESWWINDKADTKRYVGDTNVFYGEFNRY